MSSSDVFQTGYLRVSTGKEEVFLSVTPGFERGPGIERDGITLPRMRDPHTIQRVMSEKKPKKLFARDFPDARYPSTTNAWVQRAGTWTLFNHLKRFVNEHGSEYLVVGVQSCGDLTMNPWHVALIHHKGSERAELCYLDSPFKDDFREPLIERSYRCLVKWNPGLREQSYEFLDLKFESRGNGFQASIVDEPFLLKEHNTESLREKNIDPRDISSSIEFALSGKPIIERGRDLSIANAVDRFQDARHIFNIPTVEASGAISSQQITKLNFGEHVLYSNLNTRRAALNSAILVDLKTNNTEVRWEALEAILSNQKHYKKTADSPTRRGEFRRYSESTVEIFYPHNVYPFGVLGGKSDELVCLASGGLSGRVGNTLDGVIRIVYNFFGCRDAIVLDEGFDTFQLVNPSSRTTETGPAQYQYDNEALLKQVAAFTRWRANKDHEDSIKRDESGGPTETELYHNKIIPDEPDKRFERWPLNTPVFQELDDYCKSRHIAAQEPRYLDAFAVAPFRSQIRAVIILAVHKSALDGAAGRRAGSERTTMPPP